MADKDLPAKGEENSTAKNAVSEIDVPSGADSSVPNSVQKNTEPAPEEDALPDYPSELDEFGLDAFLENEHPDFTKGLQAIGADKTLVAQDILLSDSEQQVADEIELWKHGSKFKKITVRVLPFMPRLFLVIKRLRFKFFLYARGLLVRFKNFSYYLATDGRDSIIKNFKAQIVRLGGALQKQAASFKKLTLKEKLAGVGLLIFAIATSAFIFQSYKHGFIRNEDELFIPSLSAVADEAIEYDPETEMEPFYDNLRSTQNLFLMPKMVVNLRRGATSGRNPMVALELFVEGMAPEVIIEMKDREAMLRDALQREIEDFSFEQLDTSDGKNELRDKIKNKINTLLIRGTVRKVLIKTIILKP